jgi:imidazolonepropionase
MNPDWLIHNINLATMNPEAGVAYGAINHGLVAIKDKRILWVGKQEKAPDFSNCPVIDGQQGWLTPGLIDCHTHLVYGGHRAKEFEWRLKGESYEQIAKKGGGILSTVKQTRQASEANLLEQSASRLEALLKEGVTTVEIKSGYGLDLPNELKMLRVARTLGQQYPAHIMTTFLGAHAVPPEFKNNADGYLKFLIDEVLPEVVQQKLADAVDIFIESIGFSPEQAVRLFTAANQLGLPVKGHVEQLNALGGANIVAKFNGLSVDHLEYLTESQLPHLKHHNTVAVLLPGAFYFLQETKKPPVQALFEHQIPVAVATDLNPGSSPQASLLTAMNQACVLFGLTPEQSLQGTTLHAAQALGLQSCKGQIKEGMDADLVLWPIDHPAQLSYGVNLVKPQQIWFGGNNG